MRANVAEGRTMLQDLPQILPGGPAGAFVLLVSAVVGGILWLRNFLSRDATNRSTDGAYRDAIELMRTQVRFARERADGECNRADAERARADRLLASLDAATEQIGMLRAQVSELSRRVEQLQAQLRGMAPGARSGPV